MANSTWKEDVQYHKSSEMQIKPQWSVISHIRMDIIIKIRKNEEVERCGEREHYGQAGGNVMVVSLRKEKEIPQKTNKITIWSSYLQARYLSKE